MYCCTKCGSLIDAGMTEVDCPLGCFSEDEKTTIDLRDIPIQKNNRQSGKILNNVKRYVTFDI